MRSASRLIASGLTICALAACGEPRWEELRMTGGERLLDRYAGIDTAVVLIYDPAECFTCYGSLQPWIEWGRTRPAAFSLLLTREPTTAEARGLTLHRIRYAGVIEKGFRGKRQTPVELLIIDGRVARAAVTEPGPMKSSLFREVMLSNSRPPGSRTIDEGELR